MLQPLRQLTEYVLAVKRGERPAAPELKANSDVNTLAAALEEMREELEGRDYAATFVQTLTHELKSPLAAIRATAELLAENDRVVAEGKLGADGTFVADNLLAKHDEKYVPREMAGMTAEQARKTVEETR